jgi:hypothetical protein
MPPEALGHGETQRMAAKVPCSVHRCPNGCVHLHIGALTVRLDVEAFRDVATVIGQAAAALARTAPAGRPH